MSNELFVSSANEQDVLTIKILSQDMFQASKDGKPVEANFTMRHLAPVMGKASEMKIVVGVADNAEIMLICT